MKQEKIHNIIYGSAWRNCYWFSRMLLNTDQYGAIGKNEKFMNLLITEIEPLIILDNLSEREKYKICRDTLLNNLQKFSEGESKSAIQRKNFYDEIDKEINSLDDIAVFLFTIKHIILPTNSAMKNIPNNDREFCYEYAGKILNSLGKKSVGKILTIWDDLGVKGCLNVEREEIITEFTKLRNTLESMKIFPRNIIEDNAILTAFAQEFERRMGQKRKSRAGGSLEDVVTFLFDFYGLSSHSEPEHFQTDIEVDKWFKCKDSWLIGISCKRTLRERWKQVSSADGNILSRHKIKEIWHLITYDKDLSDDKITMLGQQRHIFYLNDESERFINASNHIGMKNYVRPLSNLIDDIAKEQGIKQK
ncbi:MAG: hypothetical protein IJM82_02010 [Synergistaceae bacterium]|nr:hypothetical protein [Synergistaceae bacterium]MBR0079521.1 hypothetical protein [Synergistaceae bacterium]MBR0232767.1 hypothetical protein [Synergistaceae bacterium]MBR0252421.1 hypothetical protein [Synergistaceae bacterium]MBR0316785.1 hypothetical protein [Synergistaceae bacterium]